MHYRTAIGQAQKVKTRAWIIQCALPVFAEHGPDIPVIDDFAKAAGISRGTFYNYFRTTRELLDATLDVMSDDVIASIIPAIAGESNPVKRFATGARMYYRKATLEPTYAAILGSISGVGTLTVRQARADLQEAIDAHLVKVTDIELAEAVAFGVMVFALKTSRALTGGQDRALEVVRIMLSALGVSSSLIDEALQNPLPALDFKG